MTDRETAFETSCTYVRRSSDNGQCPALSLSARNRVLEIPTVLQIVKKFYAFYGTQSFIIAFIRARHLFLYRARSIQSTTPTPSISLTSITILYYLRFGRLPSGLITRLTAMARPQVVVKGLVHQICRVAVNVSNDQSRKGDKG